MHLENYPCVANQVNLHILACICIRLHYLYIYFLNYRLDWKNQVKFSEKVERKKWNFDINGV